MELFECNITETEPISNDVNNEALNIYKASSNALQYVGSEMILDLQNYIQNVWYSRYKPTVYKRRTDDSSLGTPLGSVQNMNVSVHGMLLEFDYKPTGEHTNSIWHTRDGDDLIEFIQNGNDKVPARPFWNMFVENQFNGAAITAFAASMAQNGYAVVTEGNDIEHDPQESMLSAGAFQAGFFDRSYDDELPF